MYIIDKNGELVYGFTSFEGIGIQGKKYLIFAPYNDNQKQQVIEMNEMQQNLANTDYKVMKYIEGQLSEEDYKPIKEQRQAWRDRFNEIESQFEPPILTPEEIERAEELANRQKPIQLVDTTRHKKKEVDNG